jgi:hypothetical protein
VIAQQRRQLEQRERIAGGCVEHRLDRGVGELARRRAQQLSGVLAIEAVQRQRVAEPPGERGAAGVGPRRG